MTAANALRKHARAANLASKRCALRKSTRYTIICTNFTSVTVKLDALAARREDASAHTIPQRGGSWAHGPRTQTNCPLPLCLTLAIYM